MTEKGKEGKRERSYTCICSDRVSGMRNIYIMHSLRSLQTEQPSSEEALEYIGVKKHHSYRFFCSTNLFL